MKTRRNFTAGCIRPTHGIASMKIALVSVALIVGAHVALAKDGHSLPATLAKGQAQSTAPAGSGFVTYADLPAFLAATQTIALAFEDFSAHDAFNVSPCYEPINSDSGQPGTSFLEPVCFHPGDVIGGFDIRSNLDWTSGITNPWGPMTGPGVFFVGANGVNPTLASNTVGATFAGATRTLIDFRDGPVAVAMDTYDVAAGSPLTVDVFAAGGVPLGTFMLQPSAPNVPAFAGFTSTVPIAEVVVHSASGVSQNIGNLRFGGVAGRLVVNDTLDFGAVGVGTSKSEPVEIDNAGDTAVSIDTVVAPSAPFAIVADGCSGTTLAAGASCSLTIAFTPALERAFTAPVTIPGGDASSEIHLHARGVLPTLALAPATLDFGAVPIGGTGGPLSATFANTTAVAIDIDSIDVPGAPFSVSGGTCTQAPFALAPGQSCTLTFSFSPQQDGVFRDRVVVESDDPSTPGEVTLRGAAGDVIFADGFDGS
jgi:hypothetical protein